MTPKAVVFDIGMVLLGWSPEAFFDREIGPNARERLFAEVDLYAMNLEIDRGRGLKAMTEACAAAHPQWADAIRLWHSHWPQMLTGPIQGSVDLMRQLKAQGTKVLALTNFGQDTMQIAQPRYDFLNEFDAMTVSGELGLIKPDQAIYAHLEGTSGLSGGELFFTDDRLENCEAAALRGWKVHHFTGAEGLEQALKSHGLI